MLSQGRSRLRSPEAILDLAEVVLLKKGCGGGPPGAGQAGEQLPNAGCETIGRKIDTGACVARECLSSLSWAWR